MAKKSGPPKGAAKAAASAAAASTSSSSQDFAASYEPVKLDLYDSGALRAALDDSARQLVIDSGYDEDFALNNVKIVLGIAPISLALYAQFGTGKFPDSWWIVLFCVLMYVALSTLLYIFSWRFEGDAFLITKPKKGQAYGLRLSSGLERYGDQYSLTVSNGKPGAPEPQCTSSWHVPGLFHADGYLAEPLFRDHVAKLLQQWEQRKQEAASKKDS